MGLIFALSSSPAWAFEGVSLQTSVGGPLDDGFAYPGYDASLWVAIWNETATFTGVTLSASTSDPAISLKDPTVKSLGSISPERDWDGARETEFDLHVAAGSGCDREASVTLTLSSDQGDDVTKVPVHIACPRPVLWARGGSLSDQLTGDPVAASVAGTPTNLHIDVVNRGTGDATAVIGHISSSSADVEITDPDAAFGTIPPDDEPVSGTFGFTVHTCDDVEVHVSLDIASKDEALEYDVRIPARCPGIHLSIDDATVGADDNGDGYLQPGERGTLRLTVRNDGKDAITGVAATLTLDGVDVAPGAQTFGDAASEAIVGASFLVHSSANAEHDYTGPVRPGGSCTMVGPGRPRDDDVHVRELRPDDSPTEEPVDEEDPVDAEDPVGDGVLGADGDGIDPSEEDGIDDDGTGSPDDGPVFEEIEGMNLEVLLNGNLHLVTEQGEVDLPVSSAVVCVLAASSDGASGVPVNGGPTMLPKTGALRTDLVLVGFAFLMLGALVRARATAGQSARQARHSSTAIAIPMSSISVMLYCWYLARSSWITSRTSSGSSNTRARPRVRTHHSLFQSSS